MRTMTEPKKIRAFYAEITGKEVLEELDVIPIGKGFNYLVKAINLRLNDPKRYMMEIYNTIADEYDDSVSRVERAMRHLISTCNNKRYKGLAVSNCINLVCIQLRGA